MEKLRDQIFNPDLALTFRMKERDFTRKRKQPFVYTLILMLNMLRKSLAIEIDNFVHYLTQRVGTKKGLDFSVSAFVQNRKKINPMVFKHLSDVVVTHFYEHDDEQKRFKGFRVLAVDGSKITLPNTEELKQCYGASKNHTDTVVVQAKVSLLYDVLNKLVIDSCLGNLAMGERELALQHQSKWQQNDLIIYDRGYSGYDFSRAHILNGIDYLIRVKATENNLVRDFIRSGKKSVVSELYPDQRQSFKGKDYNKNVPIKLRLLRIELPGGEIEVLITSLFDSQKYPSSIFKELYFLRWGIETFYDELKNKLKVEHFTGYSIQTIQQDFYCAIFISNIQSIIVNDLQQEIISENNSRRYDYKINTNLSYGFLKNRILELIVRDVPLESVLQELEALFLKNTIPIRSNRTNTRKVGKYRTRTKPIVTKNQKDAI